MNTFKKLKNYTNKNIRIRDEAALTLIVEANGDMNEGHGQEVDEEANEKIQKEKKELLEQKQKQRKR